MGIFMKCKVVFADKKVKDVFEKLKVSSRGSQLTHPKKHHQIPITNKPRNSNPNHQKSLFSPQTLYTTNLFPSTYL